ncbi:MAG: hypothetical protein KIT20_03450 [Alphaproteobacteria bacterium]|nr:hypothetical protein [Alphaproteobacteria bacterium]
MDGPGRHSGTGESPPARAGWLGHGGARRVDAAATRRNPLIGWARIGLPVLAVLLTLALFAWPYLSPKQDLTIRFEESAPTDDHARMVNPRFTGNDERNHDFLITADTAVQEARGSDRVLLQGLKAELVGRGGEWYALASRNGIYDEKRQHLTVDGGFSLYSDRGHEVHGEAAEANLRESWVGSELPVRGQGPEGQIFANGFRTEERGNVLHFLNGVRVIIYQNKEG